MRFTAEQRYTADPGAVARAYADPDLHAAMPATAKLAKPEVVAHEVDGDRVVLEVRHRFHGDLPSAARAILDPARLTWVERTVHRLDAGTATFELRPDHYPDRLQASGAFRVEATDGGARRVLDGELKVRAPLVGGTVERTLVHDLRDHLQAEVPVVEAFLAG
ncbi:MAG TPA: DUF2505 domain-containing protein [Acidimicrobiales bacterium]|nr:DUF2505 domain-containing protein [Acidimicrobiales bacterium]